MNRRGFIKSIGAGSVSAVLPSSGNQENIQEENEIAEQEDKELTEFKEYRKEKVNACINLYRACIDRSDEKDDDVKIEKYIKRVESMSIHHLDLEIEYLNKIIRTVDHIDLHKEKVRVDIG